uniref:Neur_chan_LBD domain-containing protein n=1 Tax=Brugia pahangi TaxID=6280 RepID=A0A0N4TY02_BRUPA
MLNALNFVVQTFSIHFDLRYFDKLNNANWESIDLYKYWKPRKLKQNFQKAYSCTNRKTAMQMHHMHMKFKKAVA